MKKYSYHSLGIVALLGAAMLYGVTGSLYRFIGIEFGAYYQTMVRNIIMFAIAGCVVLALRQWKQILRSDYRWFCLLGFAGALSTTTFFVGLNLLPIGTALFFFYACATISSFAIGSLFFNEEANAKKYLGLAFGIGGLLLLFSETLRYAPLTFIIVACLAGFMESIWNIFSKKVSSHYPLPQILAVDSALASVMIVPFVLLAGEQFSVPALTASWIGVIVSSFTVITGSFLIIYGYRYVQAHHGSVILLMEVIFGALIAFILFHETLSVATLSGGALIAFGAAVMNYNNRP